MIERGYMKKSSSLLLLGFLFVLAGCSSTKIDYHYGEEYSWICTTKEKAKVMGVYYNVPGEPENTCAKLESDINEVRDFYLRDWEKDYLAPMPDTP
jgi:hypothetical protein